MNMCVCLHVRVWVCVSKTEVWEALATKLKRELWPK